MNLNQSKSEKNEYKKTGGSNRSGQQRTFAGNKGGGGGGGGFTAPPLATNPSSSQSNTRSFKKVNNAPQAVQPRVGAGGPVNPAVVPNGSHSQSTTPGPGVTNQSNDMSTQRNVVPIPRGPSQPAALKSDLTTKQPSTPAKGDGAKGFPLQFGSLSPGYMNGMQVPARTTSAPPNIDELRRDQAQHVGPKGPLAPSVAPVPKPQVPRKDVAPIPLHTAVESNPEFKVKRDAPVTSAPSLSQAQKAAVLSMTGNSMQVPYPQTSISIPMQFGGPNSQMQSQGIPPSSHQMNMQLPQHMGNSSQVQQQMFMTGLQHPMMQSQGIMHQGQNLGFNPQIGQLPHHLNSAGINLPPQFSSQQPTTYNNTRKTVKITHPETHEELRLDKKIDVHTDVTSAPRTHINVPTQPYTSSQSLGFYPNSYAAGASYFSAPSSSLPSVSAPLTPIPQQAARFNYSSSQASHAGQFASRPALNSMPVSLGGTVAYTNIESSSFDSSRVIHSSPVSVTIKPAVNKTTGQRMDSKPAGKGEALKMTGPAAEISSPHLQNDSQINPGNNFAHSKPVSEQSKPISISITENVSNKASSTAAAAAFIGTPASLLKFHASVTEKFVSSEYVKDHQKKLVIKGCDELLPQPALQASTGLPQAGEGRVNSSKIISSLVGESKSDAVGSGAGNGTMKTQLEKPSAVRVTPIDGTSSGADIVLESPVCNAHEVVGIANAMGASFDHPAEQEAEISGPGKLSEKEILDGEKHICGSGTLDADTDKPAQKTEKGYLNSELKENCGAGHVDTLAVHMQSLTSPDLVSDDGTTMKTSDCRSGIEAVIKVHSSGHEGDATVIPTKVSEACSHTEGESMEIARPTSSSGSVSSSDKVSADSNKMKPTGPALARGKKKIKQILQKADAQGTTSDLYMAYKGPDEKIVDSCITEQSDNTSSNDMKLVSGELDSEDSSGKEKDDESKAEPDDWEDAADVSTPKLQSMSMLGRKLTRQDGEEAEMGKKYTRDFLLTFSEQYTNLPEGFELTSDVGDILARPNSSSSRGGDRDFPSPGSGRNLDRPSSGHKSRGSGTMDVADRWNKNPGPLPSPREMGQDSSYGPMQMGFRPGPPGHGGNHGVLRNPRAQPPAQFPILSGPMHSMQHRNNADGDRWRSINKGLMPPPQAHMHKAERKYEVGKVTDEEQAKQRKLKGILNKLTPQNFDKLFAQVKEVNIDNVTTLVGVISQIFDKALMEPTFCEMYANFCHELSQVLPELSEGDEKFTFKRLLLNKCQEEFERGEREEEEASKADSEEEENKLTAAQREEIRIKARRRMLGNIRLIGELFKKRMLTERIMHACISTLLSKYPKSGEEDIESLCKLMSTIGEMIDRSKAKHQMDLYFESMNNLSNNNELSSRVRFMLKDAIDLRRNKWQQRMKVEGPKKIEDVHRDAAQERQAQASRLNRGPSMGGPAARRGSAVDFGPRGGSGMLASPVGQTGSFRGLPQGRGYNLQDARMDERNSFNNRNPLPQRPSGDESITLGPQGGLARGMSVKGQPSLSAAPLVDSSLNHGDSRRTGGANGFGSLADRGSFNARKDSVHRYATSERLGGSQSSMHDLPATSMNSDKNEDQSMVRSIPASTPSQGVGILTGQNMSSDKVWTDERLREKSISTIREFYSAKDEKEVDVCVRELNAPKCYPSVISFWVTDSFDRKDSERQLLNGLIVALSKTRNGQLFSPDQLMKGFEAVLTDLEDTVNDAPKAPDYLGSLFAMLIIENIVSLRQICGLLFVGGEEPGRLREEGLAGDVLGSILENIKTDKGEPAMKNMCASSDLRLADFRPPDPLKSKKLELFI